MKYLLIQGNAEELTKSLEVFLKDGWKLHGSTFVTGKEVLMEETNPELLKKGYRGTWVREFAQAITWESPDQHLTPR